VPEPPFVTYRASAGLHTRNMEELLAFVRAFITRTGMSPSASMNDINDYFRAMALNPAFATPGTTPGNGTMWLFLIARQLRPKTIVESGVWRGSSLFTFRQAVPKAKITAFDVTFAHLLSRPDGVDYRERDWGNDNVRAESDSDLCFFDDHINNCLRIRQSYERGFRHVIVDDSPDLGELHQFRYPAVPSVSMIEKDKWSDGDTVLWNWNGRRLRYTFRIADTFGAKESIKAVYRFPSIKHLTGMEDAYHYYVQLKD
jgi:hypothetical protein